MLKYEKDFAFLGRGWDFPPTFSLESADGVQMADGNPVEIDPTRTIIPIIERSLYIIIQTFRGTRVMQPTFGCNLHPFLFENIDAQNKAMIKRFIEEAVLDHEPRVIIENLDIKTASEAAGTFASEPSGTLLIDLRYYVITTNSRYNYVFPFYYNEARNR